MSTNQSPFPHSLDENSSTTTTEARYFRQGGLTLIQVMLIFLVIGILGSTVANYLLDERCAADAPASVCTQKQ